jgi:hypothetical protein
MSSSEKATLTDLERDLPTTRRAVEALRRAASLAPRDAFAAVQALVDALPSKARRPRRTTTAGRPDFEL